MPDSSSAPAEITETLHSMNRYTIQSPNRRFLGVCWGRNVYCLANPKHNNFFSRYLHRHGAAPVIYDESASIRTAQQLQILLNSKGCFGSTVNFDTNNVTGNKVEVDYYLHATPRRKIDEITYTAETPEITELLKEWRQSSPLKTGDYYDQTNLTNERSQLAEWLQNEGYYTANKDIISFQVDTTYNPLQLSIAVNVHNPKLYNTTTKLLTAQPLRKYHFANIYIYPNSNTDVEPFDTTIVPSSINDHHTDYKFVHSSEMTIRPQTISHNMLLFDGMLYRPRSISSTYNLLRNLRNFKYINIEITPSPISTDTMPLLDAHVKLINSTRRKLTTSLELNNASSTSSEESALKSGNLGIEGSLELQNKNLFGGAEQLNIQLSQLVELPKLIFSGSDEERNFHNVFQTFETGLSTSLDIPKFLLPLSSNLAWQRIRPHTLISLGGSYQYRNYFERLMLNTSFGYSWSQSQRASHQLLPLEITYVHFFNLEDAFLNRISNLSDARLKYLYSDHFIMDARYDYVYNTQRFNTRSNFTYLHLSLESAGNVLNGICSLTGTDKDANGIRKVLDVPYSQYVRFSGEAKHYYYIGKKQTLVLRALAGIGIPYGNSKAMPYEKGFYGGGPNTMRAWQLRYLGPGLYHNSKDQLFERVGDMTLVANIEHRFPLFGKFEGAVFCDMGNVWLLNHSDEFDGGNITMDHFLKGIAVGSGLGLRFNFSIITLRVDAAIPVYDPGYEEGYRWRLPHWKFNQIVVNYGIDYPF
jgi:outer membrane protein assembly factor BamA